MGSPLFGFLLSSRLTDPLTFDAIKAPAQINDDVACAVDAACACSSSTMIAKAMGRPARSFLKAGVGLRYLQSLQPAPTLVSG